MIRLEDHRRASAYASRKPISGRSEGDVRWSRRLVQAVGDDGAGPTMGKPMASLLTASWKPLSQEAMNSWGSKPPA